STSRVTLKVPSLAVIFTVCPTPLGEVHTPVEALIPAGTDDQVGETILVSQSIVSLGPAKPKLGVITAGILSVRSATWLPVDDARTTLVPGALGAVNSPKKNAPPPLITDHVTRLGPVCDTS